MSVLPGSNLHRVVACAVGLWAGLLLGIGFLAAPAGFAMTTPDIAGRIAGRMFQREAYLSLLLAVLLFLFLRKQARELARSEGVSVLSANMLLVLGTLFCTVLGYFALQPMMAAARAGQGTWSFGALHGASMGLFAVKGLLVLALAWRLSGR